MGSRAWVSFGRGRCCRNPFSRPIRSSGLGLLRFLLASSPSPSLLLTSLPWMVSRSSPTSRLEAFSSDALAERRCRAAFLWEPLHTGSSPSSLLSHSAYCSGSHRSFAVSSEGLRSCSPAKQTSALPYFHASSLLAPSSSLM